MLNKINDLNEYLSTILCVTQCSVSSQVALSEKKIACKKEDSSILQTIPRETSVNTNILSFSFKRNVYLKKIIKIPTKNLKRIIRELLE